VFYQLFHNPSSKGWHVEHVELVELKQQVDMNIIEFMSTSDSIWEVLSSYCVDLFYLMSYIEKIYGYKFKSLLEVDVTLPFKDNCVNYLGFGSRVSPNGVVSSILLMDALPEIWQRCSHVLEFVLKENRWEYYFLEGKFCSQIGIFYLTQKAFIEQFIPDRDCGWGGEWSEGLLLALYGVESNGVSLKGLSRKFRKSEGHLSRKLSSIYGLPKGHFISGSDYPLYDSVY
jgi:hypothetical protein